MAETLSTTPKTTAESENESVVKELPDIPEYITGEFVNSYIEACDETIQQRFKNLCTRRRITIPNTSDNLRTEQVELFMDAI